MKPLQRADLWSLEEYAERVIGSIETVAPAPPEGDAGP